MLEKSVTWVGASLAALRAFPDSARREAGHDLWLVQAGRPPRDFRPMTDVGAGVIELRLHGNTEHRVLYVAKFDETIYVLHAFEKRSRKTSRQDLEIARARYQQVLRSRAQRTH
jgi:phage-related protein